MIDMTIVMKVFVFFGISIAKKCVFTDIFTYCNVKNGLFFSIQVYRISNQMSLIDISVDNSGVAGWKQSGRLVFNNNG